MEQNESLMDRTIRLFVGIIILFLSYFFAVGFWEILLQISFTCQISGYGYQIPGGPNLNPLR